MSDLKSLFNPASIAIVGASEGPRHGGEMMRTLQALGYSGRIYPVNPKYETVYGFQAYPSLSAISDQVECVVVAVGSRHVLNTLEEASQQGIKAALVISAGFAEAGVEGKDLQNKIKALASDTGLRIAGPNSLGLINVHDKVAMYAASLPDSLRPGGIGVIVQSGSICAAIAGANRGLGFSYLISSGNEADVCASDYIQFMLKDERTTVILGFVEGIKQPDKFIQAADLASDLGKPIILLKVGKTEKSRATTVSHTGSLAGSDSVQDALFKQKGVTRVSDLDELLEAGELFSGLHGRYPRGSGVGLITLSGGETALTYDLASEYGVDFPDLSDQTKNQLKEVLPTFAMVGNPLDVTGVGAVHRPTYKKALQLLSEEGKIHLIAIMQNVRPGQKLTLDIAQTVADVAKENQKPFVFYTNLSRGINDPLLEKLKKGNIPLLQGTRESLNAISSLITYSRFLRQRQSKQDSVNDFRIAFDNLSDRLPAEKATLGESHSKNLLKSIGIETPKEVLATNPEQALEACRRLGFPVVLKVDSHQISHKTDIGGVALGIKNEQELISSWQEILDNVERNASQTKVNGILVQEMITGGTEVIVGISHDSQFGPTILFGLGGIFVESLQDFSLRVLPITLQDAQEMVDETLAGKVLRGIRGGEQKDIPALIDVIIRVAKLTMECQGRIEEIDINPLLVRPIGKGCVALDALIVTR
jgi:acetate---CoA ligase (ADP-forming)